MRPIRYQKKPLIVEAVNLDLVSHNDIVVIFNTVFYVLYDADKDTNYIEIETLGGTLRGIHGDFIIKDVVGEFYPCKPKVFEISYEECE